MLSVVLCCVVSVLAARRSDAADETRREPGQGRVLGHEEPPAPQRDHLPLGELHGVGLLQGQPQPPLRHVR